MAHDSDRYYLASYINPAPVIGGTGTTGQCTEKTIRGYAGFGGSAVNAMKRVAGAWIGVAKPRGFDTGYGKAEHIQVLVQAWRLLRKGVTRLWVWFSYNRCYQFPSFMLSAT
jgi:hypothetical protein